MKRAIISGVNPNWKTRTICIKGLGISLQAWSKQRNKWLHLSWV